MTRATTDSLLREGHDVRHHVTSAIRSSVKSRETIAEEMTAALGRPVTLRSLNSYTSESADQNRFPLEYLIALCRAVEDFSVLESLVGRAGFRMIGPDEERLIEIGRAFVEKTKVEKILARAKREVTL